MAKSSSAHAGIKPGPGPRAPAPRKAGEKPPPVADTPRDTAFRLLAAGFWPVVIRPGEKRPVGKAWGSKRKTPDDLAAEFKANPGAGVGVCLGPGRGPDETWLIDVEGDGPEAEESRRKLYAGELVETLGWGSARGGHDMLRVDRDRVVPLVARLGSLEGKGHASGVYKFPSLPGLEIRLGGHGEDGTPKQLQSVFPPTPGKDGQCRVWNGVAKIAEAPESFYQALEAAASQAATPPAASPAPAPRRPPNGRPVRSREERAIAYLNACQPAVSGQGGHDQTWKAACKIGPGFDLPEDTALRLIRDYYNPRCEPPWSEKELAHKVSDAYRLETRRGWLLDRNAGGPINGNGRHFGGGFGLPPSDGAPTSTEPIKPNEAVDDPHRLARLFMRERCTEAGGITLRFWKGEFNRWDGAYRCVADKDVHAEVSLCCKREFDRVNVRDIREWEAGGEKGPKPTARKVSKGLVGNVAGALSGYTQIPDRTRQPAWLEGEGPFPPHEVLPARNALIHLPSFVAGVDAIRQPSPSFFCPYALDYDFDRDAPKPERWLSFLDELWPDDPDSISTLQQWMGYLLLPDTKHQKILMLIGPKRSGKGTIARVISALIGRDNVANPTLASLGTNFGLAPLIGKPAAIITDARLSGKSDIASVVERLLSISGEDGQTIDIKHKTPWSGRLSARFTIISNELPRLTESSGALAGRLIVLRAYRSFFGEEDLGLESRLTAELPGILMWAIEGWRLLRERGRFVQPRSAAEIVEELEDLASPIGTFVKERCVVRAEEEIPIKTLFLAWKEWCQENNREHVGDVHGFGKNIRAAVPGITRKSMRTDGRPTHGYVGIGLRDAF